MSHSRIGLSALVIMPLLAAPVSAQLAIDGYRPFFSYGLGVSDDESGAESDRFVDEEFDFGGRGSLIADNGITFSSRLEFDDDATGQEIDEAFAFVRGNFGSILIGSEDGSFSNGRRPAGFTAGGCARRDEGGEFRIGGAYRFDGVALKAGYLGFTGDSGRSALATEDGGGNLVNPAVGFKYRLDGLFAGARFNYCIDTGRLFPTKLGVSFDYSDLGADDSFQNQALPYGLGITGVGYAPGVFINAPTDIRYGNFSIDRTSFGGGLEVVHPFGVRIPPDVARSSRALALLQDEVLRVNSVIFGLNFDVADQDERTWFMTDTPAFGANSMSDVRYDTSFDIETVGIYAGFQQERHYVNGNGVTTSGFLRAVVGYAYHDVEAYDRVWANGLGGALNINQSNRFSDSDGMETFELAVGLNRSKGNLSGGFTLAANYGGFALIDYFRPDSTGGGAPLDPEIGIDGDWSYRIGASVRLNF